MNRSRHRTPPKPRRRRNSIGTPSDEGRRRGGRRRSNSISSPAEAKDLVKKQKVNFKNTSRNIFSNGKLSTSMSKRRTGAKYMRKVRIKRKKKKDAEIEKKKRIAKANQRFNKITHYSAEYCPGYSKDIMKRIKERVGRFIESEIVRSRHRREDIAAERIKNWYFKYLPQRREFRAYWKEKQKNIREAQEKKKQEEEGTPGGFGYADQLNPMTPENRVIRMKEQFIKKYSPAPSPSSHSKKDRKDSKEYVGDELDDLDDEYNIDPSESSRKERESVESSILEVGDLEKTEIGNIVDFLKEYGGSEDEDEDEEIEGEDGGEGEKGVNYAEFALTDSLSKEQEETKRKVIQEIIRSLRKSERKLQFEDDEEEEEEEDYIDDEEEEDVQLDLVIPPFNPGSHKKKKREEEDEEEEEEKQDGYKTTSMSRSSKLGSYSEMFEQENEKVDSYFINEMSNQKEELKNAKSPEKTRVQTSTQEIHSKEGDEGEKVSIEITNVSQSSVQQPKKNQNLSSKNESIIKSPRKELSVHLDVISEPKLEEKEELLENPFLTPKRNTKNLNLSNMKSVSKKKVVKTKVVVNKSGLGGVPKKKRTLISRKTTVTTQQTKECCTIL